MDPLSSIPIRSDERLTKETGDGEREIERDFVGVVWTGANRNVNIEAARRRF